MQMDYLYEADLSLQQVLLLHTTNLGCTESHSSSPSWFKANINSMTVLYGVFWLI